MTAYLPAGTEVVINRNGQHEWYTTQKRVDVSDYKTGICPVRDGLTVLTAEVHGFRIWFLENQVEVELNADQLNFVNNHKFIAIQYDIPTRVSTHAQNYRDERGNPFVHPSQWMWAYGVRTTLSCWLMTEEKYQAIMRRLRGLTRAGCTWNPTRIDATDAARKLMGAVVALRKEWIAADESYDANLKAADARYAERGTSLESQRTLRYDQSRIERELEKKRKNIEDGARVLGIPMSWVDGSAKSVPMVAAQNVVAPTSAYTAANQVRKAVAKIGRDETEAHCEMVDAMREKGLIAEAAAVEAGEMSHAVAADICEENEVLCDDNGVFSLRDVFKD